MLKINLFWFLISFAIGLAFVYAYNPPKHIIYKFPSPLNASNTIYRDKSNTCYKFKTKITECPLDRSQIKQQPIDNELF